MLSTQRLVECEPSTALLLHLERELTQRNTGCTAFEAATQIKAPKYLVVQLHLRQLPAAYLREQRLHFIAHGTVAG